MGQHNLGIYENAQDRIGYNVLAASLVPGSAGREAEVTIRVTTNFGAFTDSHWKAGHLA